MSGAVLPADVDWSTVITTIISAIGGVTVGALAARGKRREDKQLLIDQLQEERNFQVQERAKERQEFVDQIDRVWRDKAHTREHVNALRAHIWRGCPPPPPEPPDGYIE